MRKNVKKLMVMLILALAICSNFIASAAEIDLESVWDDILVRLNITPTDDVVYSNCPNGLPVYESQSENSEVIGSIPFLWGINRVAQIGDNWSMISYDDKNAYVRTSDVRFSRDFTVREDNYDTVIACPEGVNVYSFPYEDDNLWVGNIPASWEISRIYTLTNGWTMISYDWKNAFVKTHDLMTKVCIGNFTITYYCRCSICNGPYGDIDKDGNRLVNGVAAVDPSVIPMYSTFYVQESYGLRTCVAKDVGGGINGDHIDVFVDVSHSECESMGNTRKPVYVFKRCE